MTTSSPFLTRVKIKNYKSIAACDVALGPLTFLVGPNGSGKSNFLDALRFVSDALTTSVDHALRSRGGIGEVLNRSGQEGSFGMRLEFAMPEALEGHYAFRVGARPRGGFEMEVEECVVYQPSKEPAFYIASEGQVKGTYEALVENLIFPKMDRLHLRKAAWASPFRTVLHGLSHMRFYNLHADPLRALRTPSADVTLSADGSNMASILGRLADLNPAALRRIEEYLAAAVPGRSNR